MMPYLLARSCFVWIREREGYVLRNFRAWEGGGEYNVVRGLRRCFGMNTAVITAFAENEVGMLMEDFILQGGVDTSLIKWTKTDGIGRMCRNGINFLRNAVLASAEPLMLDRANTAISKATPEDFDFEYILENWECAGFIPEVSTRHFPNNPVRRFLLPSKQPKSMEPLYPMI